MRRGWRAASLCFCAGATRRWCRAVWRSPPRAPWCRWPRSSRGNCGPVASSTWRIENAQDFGKVPRHGLPGRPQFPLASRRIIIIFRPAARAQRSARALKPTALDDIPARPSRRPSQRIFPMSITAGRKAELIKTYATTSADTGSPEVQVAILSERIANLTEHFKTHVKDNHSRRGLLKLVSQRRQLLDFLKRSDEGRYKTLIERLGIRR